MITTTHNQSILDLAIAIYGDAGAAIYLALENGVGVSDELPAGMKLREIPGGFKPPRYTARAASTTVKKIEPYIVSYKQSLQDVAMLLAGDAQAAVQLAIINDIALGEELSPGTEINYEGITIYSRTVVDYFTRNGYVPATGSVAPAVVEPPVGVGFYLLTDDGNILLTDDQNNLIYE
jgi:hypothetical protein